MHKKIIGNPTTTPYPRPDWNQTDETKADFIKNKPVIRESYPYNIVDMASFFRICTLNTNTVTHIYGDTTETGQIAFEFASIDVADNVFEEVVLILNLTYSTTVPTVVFEREINWFNGEPPTVEIGKIYMFSFVLVKRPGDATYYLGIGGEFA